MPLYISVGVGVVQHRAWEFTVTTRIPSIAARVFWGDRACSHLLCYFFVRLEMLMGLSRIPPNFGRLFTTVRPRAGPCYDKDSTFRQKHVGLKGLLNRENHFVLFLHYDWVHTETMGLLVVLHVNVICFSKVRYWSS